MSENAYSKKPVPYQQIIEALLDESHPFPPKYLHRFSDISPEFLGALKESWTKINPDRRAVLLSDLEDLSDADTLCNFDDLGRFALEDSDPRVRAAATRLLWQAGDKSLVPVFLRMVRTDEDEVVRAAAVSALGEYVYMGELDALPAKMRRNIEDELIAIYRGSDTPLVRRRALESLGFSSREEVEGFIRSAIEMEAPWRASALFAMGRSADQQWEQSILEMIDDPDLEVQFEAVRAAGELEIAKARQPIISLLEEHDDLDEGVRYAAIWSLSQIGGEGVRELLEQLLEEAYEEEEVEHLENALDNLSFTEGGGFFNMFDFDLDNNNEDDEDA